MDNNGVSKAFLQIYITKSFYFTKTKTRLYYELDSEIIKIAIGLSKTELKFTKAEVLIFFEIIPLAFNTIISVSFSLVKSPLKLHF